MAPCLYLGIPVDGCVTAAMLTAATIARVGMHKNPAELRTPVQSRKAANATRGLHTLKPVCRNTLQSLRRRKDVDSEALCEAY